MYAKKIVFAALGAALLAGASIPALAQADRPAPGEKGPDIGGPEMNGPRGAMFKDLAFLRLLKSADGNKDGKVSKDEVTAWGDQLFTQIDANKDGTLTRGELLDYRTAKMEEFRKNNPPPAAATNDDPAKRDQADNEDDRRGPMMNDDQDDDDRGDWGWHGHHHGWHHGWRDGDRDRQDARDDMPPPPHGPMMGQEGRMGFMGPVGPGPMMGQRFFRMIDTDNDRKISKAEATAALDRLFVFLDTNKDNQITIDDLPDRPF